MHWISTCCCYLRRTILRLSFIGRRSAANSAESGGHLLELTGTPSRAGPDGRLIAAGDWSLRGGGGNSTRSLGFSVRQSVFEWSVDGLSTDVRYLFIGDLSHSAFDEASYARLRKQKTNSEMSWRRQDVAVTSFLLACVLSWQSSVTLAHYGERVNVYVIPVIFTNISSNYILNRNECLKAWR